VAGVEGTVLHYSVLVIYYIEEQSPNQLKVVKNRGTVVKNEGTFIKNKRTFVKNRRTF
jgi:hypothetical protein